MIFYNSLVAASWEEIRQHTIHEKEILQRGSINFASTGHSARGRGCKS